MSIECPKKTLVDTEKIGFEGQFPTLKAREIVERLAVSARPTHEEQQFVSDLESRAGMPIAERPSSLEVGAEGVIPARAVSHRDRTSRATAA